MKDYGKITNAFPMHTNVSVLHTLKRRENDRKNLKGDYTTSSIRRKKIKESQASEELINTIKSKQNVNIEIRSMVIKI